MDGPDHEFALEPDQLDTMVDAIRKTEAALGSGEKDILDAEEELYEKARRAVHTATAVNEGETLTHDHLKILRPGKREAGLHPKFYTELVGETAARDLEEGTGVQWDDIQ
jgi:N-acetylneuraminate synthase